VTCTDNHGYDLPERGTENWDVLLNEDFRQFDSDVEVRDSETNLRNYAPCGGAKFLAIDIGRVFLGNGSPPAVNVAVNRMHCYILTSI